MKIAITGASGFLGSVLASQLAADGHEVRGAARTLPTGSGRHPESAGCRATSHLRATPPCSSDGVDAIVHLAWTNTPLTSNAHLPSGVGEPPADADVAGRRCVQAPGVPRSCLRGARAQSTEPADSDQPLSRGSRVPASVTHYGIQKLTVEQYPAHGRRAPGGSPQRPCASAAPTASAFPPSACGVHSGRRSRSWSPVTRSGSLGNLANVARAPAPERSLSRAIEMTRVIPAPPTTCSTSTVASPTRFEGVLSLLEEVVGAPLSVHTERSEAADDLPSWVVLEVGKARDVLGWAAEIGLRDALEQLIACPRTVR